MDTTANYGGVTYKEVIAFQTKILFGAQFGRIMWAKAQGCFSEDIQDEALVACLRLGWNDAFRHVSENAPNMDKNVKEYKKQEKYKSKFLKLFRGKIKKEEKNSDFDDYFCNEVVSQKELLNIFKRYAKAGADDKSNIIEKEMGAIRELFKNVKRLDGERALSFGHMQKMFNMAVKLYLCLYACRDELGLAEELFIKEIVEKFKEAHCPVDSIILGEIDQNEMCSLGEGQPYKELSGEYKWSRLNKKGYDIIQGKIAEKCNGKSNLFYDFENWN